MSVAATLSSRMNWLRTAARLLLMIWAFFWTYFLGANLLDNTSTTPASERTKGYLFIISGLILVWSATLLAWRKEQLGRTVLLALGVLLIVFYLALPAPNLLIQDKLMTAGLIGGLPILAGLMLIIAGKK